MKYPVLIPAFLLIFLQICGCFSEKNETLSPGTNYSLQIVQPLEERIFREKILTIGLAQTPESQKELKRVQNAVGSDLKIRIRKCSVPELSGMLRSGRIDLAAGNLPEDRIRQLCLESVLGYETRTGKNALAIRRGSIRLKNYLEKREIEKK